MGDDDSGLTNLENEMSKKLQEMETFKAQVVKDVGSAPSTVTVQAESLTEVVAAVDPDAAPQDQIEDSDDEPSLRTPDLRIKRIAQLDISNLAASMSELRKAPIQPMDLCMTLEKARQQLMADDNAAMVWTDEQTEAERLLLEKATTVCNASSGLLLTLLPMYICVEDPSAEVVRAGGRLQSPNGSKEDVTASGASDSDNLLASQATDTSAYFRSKGAKLSAGDLAQVNKVLDELSKIQQAQAAPPSPLPAVSTNPTTDSSRLLPPGDAYYVQKTSSVQDGETTEVFSRGIWRFEDDGNTVVLEEAWRDTYWCGVDSQNTQWCVESEASTTIERKAVPV